MDIILFICSILAAVVAIIGSVVPVLSGALLAYFSLCLARWSNMCTFEDSFMWIMAAVTAVVFAADYFLPPLIISKMGGSKAASWGATIGMIAGIFLTPIGMFLGMVIGAFIGEYKFAGSSEKKSLQATVGAILGFVVGTGLKLSLCIYILYRIIVAVMA